MHQTFCECRSGDYLVLGIGYEFQRLDGLNWFVYCGNNPLGYVDPTGLEADPSSELDLDSESIDMLTEQMNNLSDEQLQELESGVETIVNDSLGKVIEAVDNGKSLDEVVEGIDYQQITKGIQELLKNFLF